MSYYTLLGFNQEPFSNSPDPDFLYRSPSTARCLQELEIAVRLHRGLNLVLGRVGTGKTTICRELLRQLDNDPAIETSLILDPGYATQIGFVRALCSTFGIQPERDTDLQALKDAIQNWLLTKVSEEHTTIVLLIDEGQKIRDDCLEILRELLNFETNTAKLLQIVLFAQTELWARLQAVPNLLDRINHTAELGPFSLHQTRAMIEFRMARSRREDSLPIRISRPALWTIYRATGGYPRKIIHICHHAIIIMASHHSRIMRRKWIKQSMRVLQYKTRRKGLVWTGVALACCLLLPALFWGFYGSADRILPGLPVEKGASLVASAQDTAPGEDRGSTNGSTTASTTVLRQPISTKQPSAAASGVSNASEPERKDREPAQNTTQEPPAAANRTVAAQQPTPAKKPAPTIPEELGTVPIASGNSVWDMSCTIYNSRDKKLQNRVIIPAIQQANPSLADLNRIAVNTPVHFPVLPGLASTAPGGFWVSLLNSRDLNHAFKHFSNLARQQERMLPKLRFVAAWDADHGLRFYILAGPGSAHRAGSQKIIQDLPEALQKKAGILDWTDPDDRPLLLSRMKPEEKP